MRLLDALLDLGHGQSHRSRRLMEHRLKVVAKVHLLRSQRRCRLVEGRGVGRLDLRDHGLESGRERHLLLAERHVTGTNDRHGRRLELLHQLAQASQGGADGRPHRYGRTLLPRDGHRAGRPQPHRHDPHRHANPQPGHSLLRWKGPPLAAVLTLDGPRLGNSGAAKL